MSNVVALTRRAPTDSVVKALRAALARAEAGEITAVSIAAVKPGGTTSGFDSGCTSGDAAALIGALVMNAVQLACHGIADSTSGPLPDVAGNPSPDATPESDDSVSAPCDNEPLP